jgi:hypothetical protein
MPANFTAESSYQHSDRSGTPENYVAQVTGGTICSERNEAWERVQRWVDSYRGAKDIVCRIRSGILCAAMRLSSHV